MKIWIKISSITLVLFILLLVGLIYIFDIGVSWPSSSITFAPGQPVAMTDTTEYGIKPRNIIIFIADGMGFSHLSLAMLTHQSENTTPVWRQFDVRSWHDARCTYGPLTDSGASGTAMASGTPTYFDVIGQDKDGNRVASVFELATAQNYATGIVTDSYIWDATPAAFVAHTKSRDNAKEILMQLAQSNLDLLFGELEDIGEGEVPDLQTTLQIIDQRFYRLNKDLSYQDKGVAGKPLAAIYAEDEVQDMDSSPNLLQLTDFALNHLESLEKPFILLVESEEMDAASHKNDSDRIVKGLESIQKTLELVLDYSKKDGETLVLFTSDHETGGMAAVADYDNYPNMKIRWATLNHTAAVVPLLAKGPGAKQFSSLHRNWEIGVVLKGLIVNEK